MPLLIDCYNLMHAEKPEALAGLDEFSLCDTLARTHWARERVTIVCDGRPKPDGFGDQPRSDVHVVFSGPKQSADAVIIRLIERDSAPARLTVVSSDRQIQRAARRRRANVLSSPAFLHQLVRDLAAGLDEEAKADASTDPADGTMNTDAWLRAFGFDPDELK